MKSIWLTLACCSGLILTLVAVAEDPEAGSKKTARPDAADRENASITPDWPQFRGPLGQGHAVAEKLPVKWSEVTNIRWKTRLPGAGWSSPVVANGHVWMTAFQLEGIVLKLLGVNLETGELEHDITVFKVASPGKIHPKNGHASPTPVVHDGKIYVHFGAHGTACVDQAGEIVWQTKLPYFHHHGPASSPIVVNNLLVLTCDGYERPFYDKVDRPGVKDHQFQVALHADTGEVAWKVPREGQHSYATPLAVEHSGRTYLISPCGSQIVAYDPQDGTEIWTVRHKGYSLIPRPVYGHGLVYVCTGYDQARLLAIRPDGQGDITETHVAWEFNQSVPFTPSPLLVGEELYLVSDSGIATCLDAQSGKLIWKRRLGGNFSASPVFADDKIYMLSEDGQMHVLAPGRQYKRLSLNKLNGTTFASPAIVGSAILIRSDQALYRIEEGATKKGKATTTRPAAPVKGIPSAAE